MFTYFFFFIGCLLHSLAVSRITEYTLQWELLASRLRKKKKKMTGSSKAAFCSMKDFLKETGGFAVIDGGLATEFERHGADLNDPLWSAKCLLTSPHLIHTVYPFSIHFFALFCLLCCRFNLKSNVFGISSCWTKALCFSFVCVCVCE